MKRLVSLALSCRICRLKKKGELASVANKHGVEVVSLIAPTSENRIEMIAKDAEGFVYCVSSLGVTGMRSEIKTDIKSIVEDDSQIYRYPCSRWFWYF